MCRMRGEFNHVDGVLGGEGWGKEKLEDAKNFLNLIIRLKSQVHETTCIPGSSDRKTPWRVTRELLRPGDKEKRPGRGREKGGTESPMTDISAEAMGARRQWNGTSGVQEGTAENWSVSGQSVLHRRRWNQHSSIVKSLRGLGAHKCTWKEIIRFL